MNDMFMEAVHALADVFRLVPDVFTYVFGAVFLIGFVVSLGLADKPQRALMGMAFKAFGFAVAFTFPTFGAFVALAWIAMKAAALIFLTTFMVVFRKEYTPSPLDALLRNTRTRTRL